MFLIWATGCGARTYALIERAASDLACPEEQVLVTQVDHQVHEARGCGQRRRYSYACTNKRCVWIPNEPIQAASDGATTRLLARFEITRARRKILSYSRIAAWLWILPAFLAAAIVLPYAAG